MVNKSSYYSTINVNRSRLTLRDDLVFVPQEYRGRTYYHIKSISTATFYRIGYAEYVFISLLDGNTTFSEALAHTARKLGASALTSQQALTVYMWLLENNLGQIEESHETFRPMEKTKNKQHGLLGARSSYLHPWRMLM